MVSKRYFEDSGAEQDPPNGKRMRSRPSLAAVIGEVMVTNFLQNVCSALEPMLRKVVREEVENGLTQGIRTLSRNASLRIQAPQDQPSLQLMFTEKLSLPVFTGTKIVDIHNDPLRIILVDVRGGQLIQTSPHCPIKVEIVVLDGDFPSDDHDTWTNVEFEKNIVRERTGKRPLLTGDTSHANLRGGSVDVGEIEFTDNSSWIRSRRFRLGAKVVPGSNQGVLVREAITEAFVVKDHRGELYRKHHPPMLEDEVWRLEKIGKDGVFHKKLASAGILTVQDFLKLLVVQPSELRKILGVGMSEKMWAVTVRHARTCVLGRKLYVSRESDHVILFNPICQVVKAVINGQVHSHPGSIDRVYLENLVRSAYVNWGALDEFDGYANETPLLTHDEHGAPHQGIVKPCQQRLLLGDGAVAPLPCKAQAGHSNAWAVNPTSCFSDANSECSSTLKSFFNDG